MRPVSAARLSFPLSSGTVALGPDGTIERVLAGPSSAISYIDSGGRVTVRIDDVEIAWPEAAVAADVDEVEFHYLGRQDLTLMIRHSFTAGWGIRVTLVNQTLDPLPLTAELAWAPTASSHARALAAGATGAYAVPGPDGTGPLLGGELVLGTCDAVTADGIGLGRFTLDPLKRRVVQWRWDWFDSPAEFWYARFPALPRDLVLPVGEAALIAADDDEAVVALGADSQWRGGQIELSSPDPQQVTVQVSSRRGVTEYDIEWVAPLDEVLAELGDSLLAGPRNRAGLVRLANVDAALVMQRLVSVGATGDPDVADDALRLFSSRLEGCSITGGREVAFLCREFDRLGEEDLLERATEALLRLTDPVPGLGLATAQVCVARLALGWSVEPLLTRLRALTAAGDPGADLDRTGIALELALVGGPRLPGAVEPDGLEHAEVWSTRVGTALGAGLPGRPIRPLPVEQQAYLATVLDLLPEPLAYRMRPEWGCRLHDVVRRAQAEVLALLAHRPPGPALSWLIMGSRLA